MFSGEVEKQLEGPMLLEVGLGLFQYVTVDSVGVPLDKTMLLVLLELQAENQLCCHSSSPRNEGRDSEAISHAKLSCLRPTKLGFVAFKQHAAACLEDAKMVSC